ncbi:hypothetical protein LTR86_002586 [Recurvomyces mirabilis]|nr:hypothetical protein LTR86_002586 [Recurvomyces mirabilis]
MNNTQSFAQSVATDTGTNATHNDAECAPLSGIKVLIVGAGVGGLVAALECHRKGHHVRIFERSPSASAGGDMFTVGLSARRFIDHYPTLKQEYDDISLHDAHMQYRKWTGEPIGEAWPFSKMMGVSGTIDPHKLPMVTQIRPLFHAVLHHQVQRFGIEIAYGKRILEYYEDTTRGVGGVVDDRGERIEADLVIAADGLHSHSRDVVLGVKEYFGLKDGKHPLMQGWLGPETHTMLLSYVDKQGKNGRMCWGLNLNMPLEEDTNAKESWHHTVTREYVLNAMERVPGFGEPMKALIRTMPEGSIVEWPLLWRNPNPCTYSEGCRVLQIGDAAHSFLPASGNGATQAIEDAITIAACLQHAGKDDIPTAVKTHALLRGDRVSCAQFLGFYNAERFQKSDMKTVGTDPTKVNAKVPKWIWMSDPEIYANEKYEEAAASLRSEGSGFKNTNIPTGYVPEKWSIESIEELHKQGKLVELSGDWS